MIDSSHIFTLHLQARLPSRILKDLNHMTPCPPGAARTVAPQVSSRNSSEAQRAHVRHPCRSAAPPRGLLRSTWIRQTLHPPVPLPLPGWRRWRWETQLFTDGKKISLFGATVCDSVHRVKLNVPLGKRRLIFQKTHRERTASTVSLSGMEALTASACS